jgi:hypothetical protein
MDSFPLASTRRSCRALALPPGADLKVCSYLDSSLRVETLSFEEAADFNPQEYFTYFMTISPAPSGRPEGHQQNNLPATD